MSFVAWHGDFKVRMSPMYAAESVGTEAWVWNDDRLRQTYVYAITFASHGKNQCGFSCAVTNTQICIGQGNQDSSR